MKKGGFKKKVLSFTLASALGTTSLVPVFAQNLNQVPVSEDEVEIIPISHQYHWAEIYFEELLKKYDTKDIFERKNFNDFIGVGDFEKLVKLTIDENYSTEINEATRETVVNELVKIWAEKTGKDLENIAIIKMLIYTDISEITPEYIHNIYIAYMHNIAKGKGAGIFDPKTKVTYGELAALITNTIKAIEKELVADGNVIEKGKFENKAIYEIKDDKVIFNFQLINGFNEPKELLFGSGQQFEITITDESGEEVYRYSDGKFFTLALIYKTINPGESLSWQDEWDMTNKEGERLHSGKYTATIKILAMPAEENGVIEVEQLTTVLELNL